MLRCICEKDRSTDAITYVVFLLKTKGICIQTRQFSLEYFDAAEIVSSDDYNLKILILINSQGKSVILWSHINLDLLLKITAATEGWLYERI